MAAARSARGARATAAAAACVSGAAGCSAAGSGGCAQEKTCWRRRWSALSREARCVAAAAVARAVHATARACSQQ